MIELDRCNHIVSSSTSQIIHSWNRLVKFISVVAHGVVRVNCRQVPSPNFERSDEVQILEGLMRSGDQVR